MNKFKVGDEAYLSDGRQVRVTGLAQSGHFVAQIYEDHEGHIGVHSDEDSFFVRKLYAAVPDPIKDSRIVRLEADIKAKRAELQELKKSIVQQKNEISSIFALYEPLTYLKDFIDGTLTYAVIWSNYDIDMGLTSEILKTDNRHDSGLRLVSLFGKNSKEFQWKVSKYSDGSDVNYPKNIIFCRTKEEAFKHAQKLAHERFGRARKDGAGRDCFIDDLVKLGIVIPEDIQEKNLAHAEEELQRVKKFAECEMARAKDRYEMACDRLAKLCPQTTSKGCYHE